MSGLWRKVKVLWFLIRLCWIRKKIGANDAHITLEIRWP